MKRLFVCSTPYHIYVCLSIIYSIGNGDNDIVILNHFDNSKNIADRVKTSKYIHEVVCVDSKRFIDLEEGNILNTLKLFLRAKSITAKYVDLKFQYDQLYTAGHERLTDLINITCHRTNRKIENFLYEEGIASYIPHNLDNTKNQKLFYSLTRSDYLEYKSGKAFLFSPELCEKGYFSEINQIVLTKEFRCFSKHVFDYNQDIEIEKYEYIFLDQPLTLDKAIMQSIFNKLGKSKEILYKRHPRGSSIDVGISVKSFPNNCMWEVFCQDNNLNELSLVSFFSTACFIPKILFNQEPKVILLYKMKEFENLAISKKYKAFDQFVERFSSLYKDSARVILPKNIEDFFASITEVI